MTNTTRDERFGRWLKERTDSPAKTQESAFIEFHESLSAFKRTLDAFAYPDFHQEIANAMIGKGGKLTITMQVGLKQLEDGNGLKLDWEWGAESNDLHSVLDDLVRALYHEGAGLRVDAQSRSSERVRAGALKP
ncbi:MAG: hypothetical protein F4Y86_05090 [Gammaproteobacteria bacterium]|nr:hypothetical protein [Gammaproteobacteria bacterium]